MIELINCSKEYSGSLVIKSVSLNLEKTGVVLMLGGNGAGKSTLLKLMAGILPPSSGEVRQSLAVTYMGHELMLYPQLSVQENLELFCALGLVDKDKLIQAYSEFEIESIRSKTVSSLSQGQKTRVNLARVFSISGKGAIFLDEASSALDLKWKEKFISKIKQISEERLVLLVTHDPQAYYEFTSRVLFLDQGKLIYDKDFTHDQYSTIDQLYRESLR